MLDNLLKYRAVRKMLDEVLTTLDSTADFINYPRAKTREFEATQAHS